MITQIRNVRANMNVRPSKKAKLISLATNPGLASILVARSTSAVNFVCSVCSLCFSSAKSTKSSNESKVNFCNNRRKRRNPKLQRILEKISLW